MRQQGSETGKRDDLFLQGYLRTDSGTLKVDISGNGPTVDIALDFQPLPVAGPGAASPALEISQNPPWYRCTIPMGAVQRHNTEQPDGSVVTEVRVPLGTVRTLQGMGRCVIRRLAPEMPPTNPGADTAAGQDPIVELVCVVGRPPTIGLAGQDPAARHPLQFGPAYTY